MTAVKVNTPISKHSKAIIKIPGLDQPNDNSHDAINSNYQQLPHKSMPVSKYSDRDFPQQHHINIKDEDLLNSINISKISEASISENSSLQLFPDNNIEEKKTHIRSDAISSTTNKNSSQGSKKNRTCPPVFIPNIYNLNPTILKKKSMSISNYCR